ncbi:MAG: heparinase II/III family protein [Rhodobacteraceae bacterium]|nr:heparinase II/III family protein [Paracoccaceae bacterium]
MARFSKICWLSVAKVLCSMSACDRLRVLVAALLLFSFGTMAQESKPGLLDLSKVVSAPHPRTVRPSPLPTSTLQLLTDQVAKNAQAALMSEPDLALLTSSSSADAARASNKIAGAVNNETERLLAAAYHWVLTGDGISKADAQRRALHLSGWSPRGVTGVWYQDQAARSIAWSLALAYDWLYSQWSSEEKQLLLNAIRPRVEDMLGKPVSGYPTGWAGLDGGGKLDRSPYDSHGVTTIARLAVICSALAGNGQVFDHCYREVLPRYTTRPIPWGGNDGGFANGTAYAHWGVFSTHFAVWDLLKPAIGTDLWHTKWAQNHLNFLAYFLPPGSPSGLFGDGAEGRWGAIWAAQAKVYASHYSSPLADWYARNQFGEDSVSFPMLISPRRQWDSVFAKIPPGTPNSTHIPSIGWVAMHSDLGDRARTSIYFKSSPFGSFNHSHADQNSFVINARGRSLAIDSGYYDYYGSPHWANWYKQTRAHNAITFDGGKGQLHDTLGAKGRIIRFEHTFNHDVATGDATVAYGGALTQALRSLIYARPNLLLVVDSLVSETARVWEWNVHALKKMALSSGHELEIEHEGVRLCVRMLDAPAGSFSQDDHFTAQPEGNYSPQWHARYASFQKSKEASFVALLDIECKQPTTLLKKIAGKTTIRLDTLQIEIGPNGLAEIRP